MNKFQQYTQQWIKKETKKRKERRALKILSILKKQYQRSKIALKFGNAIQLLVAVMLSAQCTDKKVNEVTATLFKKYKSAGDFASADQKTFEREIYPTGFYRVKARNIIKASRIIQKSFGGKLPKTMEGMLSLPGVARKTANIVLGNAYGIVEGIAVDTHVGRLAQRLGLSARTNPKKIEEDLMSLYPKKEWFNLTYKLIDHGRALCTAKNRKCSPCPLKNICPSSLASLQRDNLYS